MIKVENLTKVFKKPIRGKGLWGMFKTLFSTKYEIKTAVNDISFEINDGDIIGYIGSNGAGKSTTIKMLCGILNPSGGKILINDLNPAKERIKVVKNIGVVFGQRTQLWWDLPLRESFAIIKEIYNVSDKDYEERMAYFTELLGLDTFISSPVRTLSLGQRMRADLAASLLHNPAILFLDEPTIGLDVLVKEKIRQAIKEINQKYNTTIILTTHDMQDIEDLCNRVIIIDEGKIIYDGKLKEIKNRFGDNRIINFQVKSPDILSSIQLDELFNNIKVSYEVKDNELSILYNALDITFNEITEIVFKNFEIVDMKIKENSVENVIKHIYEKGL